MTQPFETVPTKCAHCGAKLKVPAGRRRRLLRLGRPVVDFCSAACNKTYVSIAGKKGQLEALKLKITNDNAVTGNSSADPRPHSSP